MAVLKKLGVPLSWVVAGQDREAPIERTREARWRGQKRPWPLPRRRMIIEANKYIPRIDFSG
jgi:hypothetical protein